MSNVYAKSSFNVRKMAIVGVLGAISAVLGMTPIGFIPVGPTSATIMHIPVIIGAIVEGPVVGMLVGLIFGIFSLIRAITTPTIISPVFYNPLVSILPRVLIGLVSYYTFVAVKKMNKKTSIIILISIWLSVLAYLSFSFAKNIGLYSSGSMSITKLVFSGILVLITIIIGWLSYKKLNHNALDLIVGTIAGTLTNTVGVLGMIYVFYGRWYVEMMGGDPDLAGKIILGVGIANGIPEVIIAVIIVTSVILGMKKQFR
ncbi:ECF transporter S component [Proteiniborus sp.]|uniref:ECF transporter S component n=1 Tax=Proteiniborus sp. TaxID=2079015 RepID=UPI00331C6FB1